MIIAGCLHVGMGTFCILANVGGKQVLNILLVEDMEDSRNLIIKLVMCIVRMCAIAPKTSQELREIASSKLKFDLILLDGCLRHWGDVRNYKGVLEDIFKALKRDGVIIGISTSPGILGEMEVVLKEKIERERRSGLHFIQGGKSLDALSGALDEALRLLEQAKIEGGRMGRYILVENHELVRTCKNCRVKSTRSNSQVVGLDAIDTIKVIDLEQPARFWASSINSRHGLGEAGEYSPEIGWKEQDEVLNLPREARDAWVRFDLELNYPVLMRR